MKSLSSMLCLLATILAASPSFAGDKPSFPKGTLSFQSYTTCAGGIDAKEVFYSGVVGGSYYVFDDVSLGLEASGYQVTQSPGHDTSMGGLAVVLRHHFLDVDRVTLFADVSFGPTIATDRVPQGGTYLNFTPRTGLGATYLLHDHFYLMGGARYFHLSNAHIDGPLRNPSVNGIEGYVGLMWTF